jgi:lysozyme
MEPSKMLFQLVKTEEGLIKPQPDGLYHAYHGKADRLGVWTIGYGVTWYPNGKAVKEGDKGDANDIQMWLEWHVDRVADMIAAHLGKITPTQNQFDALVDIAYNLGPEGIIASTLFKKFLVNPNDPTIYNAVLGSENIPIVGYCEFMKWVYSNHKVVDDLVWRRYRECCLYQGKAFHLKDGTPFLFS